MARDRIGGSLDYAQLATAHRPLDRDSQAREARRLAAQGLKPADLALAFGLSAEAMRHLLAPEADSA